jgi:hypothetical protein
MLDVPVFAIEYEPLQAARPLLSLGAAPFATRNLLESHFSKCYQVEAKVLPFMQIVQFDPPIKGENRRMAIFESIGSFAKLLYLSAGIVAAF